MTHVLPSISFKFTTSRAPSPTSSSTPCRLITNFNFAHLDYRPGCISLQERQKDAARSDDQRHPSLPKDLPPTIERYAAFTNFLEIHNDSIVRTIYSMRKVADPPIDPETQMISFCFLYRLDCGALCEIFGRPLEEFLSVSCSFDFDDCVSWSTFPLQWPTSKEAEWNSVADWKNPVPTLSCWLWHGWVTSPEELPILEKKVGEMVKEGKVWKWRPFSPAEVKELARITLLPPTETLISLCLLCLLSCYSC